MDRLDSFLDQLWMKIVAVAVFAADGLDALLTPLHGLGPAAILSILAVFTVVVTKTLNRLVITKRFIHLEKEFQRLSQLRREAMQCEDREKGRLMAKNIDKGELNRVYYDYFFEGLLLGLARKVLPVAILVAFINEYFRPERLSALFGKIYVFKFNGLGGEPILIGAVFWYVLSLLVGYLAWSLVQRKLNRRKKKDLLPSAFLSESM